MMSDTQTRREEDEVARSAGRGGAEEPAMADAHEDGRSSCIRGEINTAIVVARARPRPRSLGSAAGPRPDTRRFSIRA